VISGKHIFHNYGHGGAGISLAYGSAYISAKSVSVYVGASQLKAAKCAVLGCGIMGLFTSIELAKRGYLTSIYTEAIPQPGAQKDLLTSQVAVGKWQPGGYDH
jgi:D-amino-acid oxidase